MMIKKQHHNRVESTLEEMKDFSSKMERLGKHLAKVNQTAESWPDWKKDILNSKVKTFDEEKERGITIKPFTYNSKDLKTFELGDMVYEVIQNNRIEFLKEVDLAIKEYFLYKYNRDIDELIRISKNVNNFKINDRFHKVSTLSEMKDCYLTTYQGYGNSYIVKHWLDE